MKVSLWKEDLVAAAVLLAAMVAFPLVVFALDKVAP